MCDLKYIVVTTSSDQYLVRVGIQNFCFLVACSALVLMVIFLVIC